ncbi:MAG TPA: thiamine-phosphate kinase [Rhizomicrobium sp.]|nr:thiamine-phosphate kinase [Rhizomicrobium sp.]
MTNSSSDKPSEFDLIAKLFAPLSKSAPGAFGLTDDAAVIAPPASHELVITTDALVEGVHFRKDDPADTIAKKALRVNLSDLAAKGAQPIGYLLAISLPKHVGMPWLESFARGLGEDQAQYGVALYGGDTTSTPGPLTLAITAFGSVPAGQMIRRAGAKPGDLVFVSGTIGDAGAGLKAAQSDYLVNRYRVPEPRMALGIALRGIASAALDVSDGLLADLGHIADTSKVKIIVDAARMPRSSELKALAGDSIDAIVQAATAGDDYEIAFTAPASKRDAVVEAARKSGTAVTRIGRVEQGAGVSLLDDRGNNIAVPRAGYVHF